ncbi:MAG: ABC transporter substrate-binding protein, partial [Planctomycetota bacterium]|nr:ABC transporter substrate-binding protein [Planctomycetota bacterium]
MTNNAGFTNIPRKAVRIHILGRQHPVGYGSDRWSPLLARCRISQESSPHDPIFETNQELISMKKRNFIRLASVSIATLALSWLSGCGGDPAPKPGNVGTKTKVDPKPKSDGATGGTTGEPIVIAIAGPMTGGGAAFGEMIRNAAVLKGKEINEAGGIKGRPIKFQVEDDKGAAQEATSVSRKITSDESIVAVIGHFNSDCSLAAKPEYNRVGILQLSPGSTNI